MDFDPKEAGAATAERLVAYEPDAAGTVANGLQGIWVRAAPVRRPEPGEDYGPGEAGLDATGVPVPVLRAVGKEIGRHARRRVADFVPLIERLWAHYGREGRIVAAVALGSMELAEPDLIVPVIYELAQRCAYWEDCDQLAMKALEPVLRKDPDAWIDRIGAWVTNDNKWVRRAALTALGRLPMERPEYTARVVPLLAPALGDPDRDVKRALSFALRVAARGEAEPVKQFIRDRQGVTDADSLWVLSDVARSMTPSLRPEFAGLLPLYHRWLDTAEPAARRSVEAAVRVLEQATT
ncbi:MAG TPA: DNA alkylation repair protein [Anaerolineae bacterium]|nr:DNA alkylation repair protein [Anaerolineae bacterium]